MRLLVVKLGAFGDLVHALPALDDLLARPEIKEVHWLVDRRYAFVTELFPETVRVHEIATRGPGALRDAWRTIRALRRLRFDVVLDLQGLLKSGLVARAAGHRVYGFDAARSPERGNALFLRPVPFHPEERHVVQQYRRIAAAPFAGAARPAEPMAYRPPHVELAPRFARAGEAVRGRFGLEERGYVVLHLGGGWQTKRLPGESWRRVARGVRARGLTPVWSWGTAEERRDAETCAGGEDRVLPERLEMPALCGLLAGARAVIGADTGVLHLAAALATPTATFWGPSASWRSAPLGARHLQVESHPACGPCFRRTCRDFVCMERIDAEELIGILDE